MNDIPGSRPAWFRAWLDTDHHGVHEELGDPAAGDAMRRLRRRARILDGFQVGYFAVSFLAIAALIVLGVVEHDARVRQEKRDRLILTVLGDFGAYVTANNPDDLARARDRIVADEKELARLGGPRLPVPPPPTSGSSAPAFGPAGPGPTSPTTATAPATGPAARPGSSSTSTTTAPRPPPATSPPPASSTTTSTTRRGVLPPVTLPTLPTLPVRAAEPPAAAARGRLGVFPAVAAVALAAAVLMVLSHRRPPPR